MMSLLLWLEAPLQAWGVSSRFGRRDTLPFPTRSGVLGLLCCAMGRSGEQREFLAEMCRLSQSIVAYSRVLPARTEKVQTNPFLVDFQMVGSGYTMEDDWQSLNVPRKSDGSKPVGAGTKMTYRYYIQDMAFACAIDIPQKYMAEVVECVKNPIWPVCLGRKCCVPTAPVYAGTFASIDDGLLSAQVLAQERGRKEIFRVVSGECADGEVLTLNDVPLSFGLHKKYSDRRVTVVPAINE